MANTKQRADQGFYIRQYVPSDHVAGNAIHSELKGAEVIGRSALSWTPIRDRGTINDIQIKLTDGRVIKMHGYFTDCGFSIGGE